MLIIPQKGSYSISSQDSFASIADSAPTYVAARSVWNSPYYTTLWEQITLINDKDVAVDSPKQEQQQYETYKSYIAISVPEETGTNTTLWEQITFINDEMKLIYDIHSNLETKKGAAKLLHNVLKQGSYCWKSDVDSVSNHQGELEFS
ncbi:hypothetical protein RCL_jg5067.t1 [Rhizophagus clarus]|uniref:Uncharacterized protein n=1 Tax=Rhizophagus clarus TaxID=94130 RepID=A0A8H3LB01_9GLOM|nr:hypothetical protein RCL_jg5067.t1 [Rhizophagus clarus]